MDLVSIGWASDHGEYLLSCTMQKIYQCFCLCALIELTTFLVLFNMVNVCSVCGKCLSEFTHKHSSNICQLPSNFS